MVQEAIDYVQKEMCEAVRVWRARAAGGLEWERERGEKREWLRLVVRAWHSEARNSEEGRGRAEEQQQTQEETQPESRAGAAETAEGGGGVRGGQRADRGRRGHHARGTRAGAGRGVENGTTWQAARREARGGSNKGRSSVAQVK